MSEAPAQSLSAMNFRVSSVSTMRSSAPVGGLAGLAGAGGDGHGLPPATVA